MNTPRTDANDLGWQFNEQYGDFDALSDTPMHWLDFAQMLEEELNAVTEQRDTIEGMYHKVIAVVLDCDPISACKRENDQLESPWEVIARVREQRDRLEDILNQCLQAIPCGYIPNHTVENLPAIIQNQSANIAKEINRGESLEEQRDTIEGMYHKVIAVVLDCDPISACKRENDQLESPWEVIARVREQRDRLADLVKQFIYILDIKEESDGGRLFHPTNITSCRAGDLQKIAELVEALRRASRNQSLNQDHFPDVGNMIGTTTTEP